MRQNPRYTFKKCPKLDTIFLQWGFPTPYKLFSVYFIYILRITRKYFWSCWVRTRFQLGTRYIGNQLKSPFLAGNELVPSTTKNPASLRADMIFYLFWDVQDGKSLIARIQQQPEMIVLYLKKYYSNKFVK